jgi:hypothetical protein
MNGRHVAKKNVRGGKMGVTAGAYLNKADARAIEEHIGRGGAGGAWGMMALDPFAETLMSAVRIPDNTVGQTAAFLSRFEHTIAPPASLPLNTMWDCVVITLPFPEAPVLCFTKPSINPLFPVGLPDGPTGQTILLWGQAVTPGSVTGNSSNILATPSPSFLTNAEAFRTTHKGISIIYDDAEIEKRGRVFGMQMRTAIQTITREGSDTDAGPPVVWDGEMSTSLQQHRIPLDQGSMYSTCPDMSRWLAKHGAYLVNRFTQPIHPYMSSSGRSRVVGDKDTRAKKVNLSFVYDDGTEQAYNLQYLGKRAVVSGQDNTQIGIMLFKGLGSTGTLDLKFVQGHEVQVDPGTPWSLFVEKAPDPDQKALDDQILIQDRLPYVYPEKYNAWAALIPVIGNVIASLATWGLGKAINWVTSRKPKSNVNAANHAIFDADQLD